MPLANWKELREPQISQIKTGEMAISMHYLVGLHTYPQGKASALPLPEYAPEIVAINYNGFDEGRILFQRHDCHESNEENRARNFEFF